MELSNKRGAAAEKSVRSKARRSTELVEAEEDDQGKSSMLAVACIVENRSREVVVAVARSYRSVDIFTLVALCLAFETASCWLNFLFADSFTGLLTGPHTPRHWIFSANSLQMRSSFMGLRAKGLQSLCSAEA